MDKHDLELLTEFCTEQRWNFDPNAWHSPQCVDSRLLAVTARYLSMTSWYGHELDLEMIGEALLPGISDKRRFDAVLAELSIDIPYLSATVRYRSEMRRILARTAPRFWPYARAADSGQTTAEASNAG